MGSTLQESGQLHGKGSGMECAVVSPSLKEILAREPEDFETTIKALLG